MYSKNYDIKRAILKGKVTTNWLSISNNCFLVFLVNNLIQFENRQLLLFSYQQKWFSVRLQIAVCSDTIFKIISKFLFSIWSYNHFPLLLIFPYPIHLWYIESSRILFSLNQILNMFINSKRIYYFYFEKS